MTSSVQTRNDVSHKKFYALGAPRMMLLPLVAPANAPFVHHKWLGKVRTQDQAADMVNSPDKLRSAWYVVPCDAVGT